MRHAFTAFVVCAAVTIATAHADNATPPKGLSTSDWSSIRAVYEANRHAAYAVGTEFHARNFGQRWKIRFDGRGFEAAPDGGEWSWGLELVSFGREGAEQVVATPRCIDTQGGRVCYEWDDSLTEWYINDRRGLEHGFTVHKRPEANRAKSTRGRFDDAHAVDPSLVLNSRNDSPLQLVMRVRGDLRPQVSGDGRTVTFVDMNGAAVVNYSALTVVDADGITLPGWFEQCFRTGHSGSLAMIVADQNARYPLTIDPIAQQAYLKASNTNGLMSPDRFGSTVAVWGDTVVVGADQEDSSATGVNGNQTDNSSVDSGAAYVFHRSDGVWSQQAYIKASNCQEGDRFGYKVTVSGDTLLVGAPGEDSNSTGIDGNQSDNSANNSGAAYVFVRNGGVWTQQTYLKASNTGSTDGFGASVAISDETVVIAATSEDSNATGVNGDQSNNSAFGSGAAYVFVRNGSVWSQQAYLKASNTEGSDFFGTAVAISGDTVVIAATSEDSGAAGINGDQADNGLPDSGAAYIFARTDGVWSQQAYLKASNPGTGTPGDFFGTSVSASGDTVVVGANREDSGSTVINGDQADNSATDAGAAYVFVRNALGAWSQQAYLKGSNSSASDWFGTSVALSEDTVVVGAYGESSEASGGGAAYIFVRSGEVWSQQAYLTASNFGPADWFGRSVAISGDMVVIGADGEWSNATGVNGNQADNSARDAGAAYVFVRDAGGLWSQQTYLKSSNTQGAASPDRFGFSLAIDGNTVVVGAIMESSNATGVNGNELDNNSTESGAAYVFVRAGTGWSQQAYLKASNTGTVDWFGSSVDMSGDTIVVGAPQEDSNATGINGVSSDNSAFSSGAAYVFVRSGGVWSQQAYLKASNTGAGDRFGGSVAISGDTVVVGASREDSGTSGVNGNQADNSADDSGAAYVFVRDGSVWSQQAYIKASNVETGDWFGTVDLMGDSLLVGAPQEDSSAAGINGDQENNNANDSGAAYSFVRASGVWSQQAYLKASNTGAGDRFGNSVSVSNESAVVGASSEDSNATGVNGNQANNSASNSGAAYLFRRSGDGWSQEAYLKASNTSASDSFGGTVAIHDNIVVVGAEQEDSNATGVNGNQIDNSAPDSGAVYVFIRNAANTWSQLAYLKASNSGAGDRFGSRATINSNTVVIGAFLEDGIATGVNGDENNDYAPDSGAAYLFTICPDLLADVPAFVLALIRPDDFESEFPTCLSYADMNVDGLVNGADIQGFVDLLVP